MHARLGLYSIRELTLLYPVLSVPQWPQDVRYPFPQLGGARLLERHPGSIEGPEVSLCGWDHGRSEGMGDGGLDLISARDAVVLLYASPQVHERDEGAAPGLAQVVACDWEEVDVSLQQLKSWECSFLPERVLGLQISLSGRKSEDGEPCLGWG